MIGTLTSQVASLGAGGGRPFGQHPAAEILTSPPGLGVNLGARILGEFGDDPDRFVDAKARRGYLGTAPIIRASGTKKIVMARVKTPAASLTRWPAATPDPATPARWPAPLSGRWLSLAQTVV